MKRNLKLTTIFAFILGIIGLYSCNKDVETLSGPSGLSVSEVTATTAHFTWNTVTDADAYEVRLGAGTPVNVSGKTSYDAAGLVPETEYTWAVRAIRGDMVGEWAVGEKFSTTADQPATLAKPTNLVVSGVTGEGAMFSWGAVEGAKGYNIKIGEFTYDTASNSYEINTLMPETVYTWYVRAVDGDRISAWVAGRDFKTTAISYTLTAPGTVTLENFEEQSARFSWSPVSGVSGYQLMVGAERMDVRGAVSESVYNLSSATEYHWKVRAVSDAGVSRWIDGQTFTTKLYNPVGHTVTAVTHNSARLAWTAAKDGESHQVKLESVEHHTTANSYLATALESETRYEWMVRSVKNGIVGQWVEGAAFTTEVAPGGVEAPSDLKVIDILKNSATLSWTASTTAEATYEVVVNDTEPFDVAVAYYHLEGLNMGETYTWKVRAVLGDQSSEWVEGPEFGASDVAPPTNLTIDLATAANVDLSWTGSFNAKSYQIQIGNADPVDATGTTYRTAGLTTNTQYAWRVRSVRSGGLVSEWVEGPSFWAMSIYPPSASSVKTSGITNNSAVLQWSQSSTSTCTGYRIELTNVDNGTVRHINIAGRGTTIYLLSDLEMLTNYTWRIRPVRDNTPGAWSTINANTTFKTTFPAPANLRISRTTPVTETTARLEWDPVVIPDRPDILVTYRLIFNGRVDDGGILNSPYAIKQGLTPDTEYTWSVRAVWHEINEPSAWVDGPKFRTLAPPSVNDPFEYADILGDYDGSAKVSYALGDYTPWSGSIVADEQGRTYRVKTMFDQWSQDWIFEIIDGRLYVDDVTYVGDIKDQRTGQVIGKIGAQGIYTPSQDLMERGRHLIPVFWNKTERTLSIPGSTEDGRAFVVGLANFDLNGNYGGMRYDFKGGITLKLK